MGSEVLDLAGHEVGEVVRGRNPAVLPADGLRGHTGGRTDGANVTACTRPDKVRVELEEME